MKNLINSTGRVTPIANGVVTTAELDFLCEFHISGVFAGMEACGDVPLVAGSILYALKYSGDNGAGIAPQRWSSDEIYGPSQEMHALRISTMNGIKTGLNDGTEDILLVKSQLVPAQVSAQNLEQVVAQKPLSLADVKIVEALKVWTSKAQAIMQQVP